MSAIKPFLPQVLWEFDRDSEGRVDCNGILLPPCYTMELGTFLNDWLEQDPSGVDLDDASQVCKLNNSWLLYSIHIEKYSYI